MKNRKKLLTTLLLTIFLISLVSAIDCWGTFKQDTEINLIQQCPSCSYVNLTSITYPNGTIFLNEEMQKIGTNFNFTLPDSSQEGRLSYGTIGDKNGASPPDYEILCIEITKNGSLLNTGDSLTRIFVAIFFIIMMLGFYKIKNSINYDKWYEDIKKKHITTNAVKWSLAAIGYAIMKESAIVYFLLGLPIMLILMDLVFIYNVTSIALYMQSLVYIYYSMIIVLGVVFLGFIQEFFMGLINDVQNIDWGTQHD